MKKKSYMYQSAWDQHHIPYARCRQERSPDEDQDASFSRATCVYCVPLSIRLVGGRGDIFKVLSPGGLLDAENIDGVAPGFFIPKPCKHFLVKRSREPSIVVCDDSQSVLWLAPKVFCIGTLRLWLSVTLAECINVQLAPSIPGRLCGSLTRSVNGPT